MLLAAVLRIIVETCTALALALPLSTDRTAAARDALLWLARGVYYVGVPAWLGLRLTSA